MQGGHALFPSCITELLFDLFVGEIRLEIADEFGKVLTELLTWVGSADTMVLFHRSLKPS